MRRSDLISLKKKCNKKLSVCNIVVGTFTEFGVIFHLEKLKIEKFVIHSNIFEYLYYLFDVERSTSTLYVVTNSHVSGISVGINYNINYTIIISNISKYITHLTVRGKSNKISTIMCSLHLGPDSQKPAEVKGQVRLYGMKFCPFTHRIRLILSYKNIPHDTININIRNKPKWYLEIHPEGKVPALVDADDKVIVDSLVIANYLDEKYAQPPLYHEKTKDRDLELLDHYSKLVSIFSNCIHGNDSRPLSEIVAEISSLLVEFEEELKARGTVYFGGAQPGMLDILMWPWVERRKSLSLIYDEPTNFNDGNFSHLMKWMQEMKAQPFVQENECSYEKFAQLVKDLKTGNVDFDKL